MKDAKRILLAINSRIQAYIESGYEPYKEEAEALLELLEYEKSRSLNSDRLTKNN
ncbi:hypothetical protein [Atopobacter sp. AH10]|uniref:hypothetical protein n=1 Tax=Atopobacter sp. AH10 TaxID=2315861 RepID=UPI001314383A|nr:hypothetical protein [Atopobacter sp. AH10]